MIKNLFDAFNAIDEAINAGLDNVIAYTRKVQDKVQDNGGFYSLKIDIPGFEKDEIEIDIVDNILNIKAKNIDIPSFEKDEIEIDIVDIILNIKAKNVEDSKVFAFYVPKDINKEDIGASLKNGQLTITLPKKTKPTTTTRKIKVN